MQGNYSYSAASSPAAAVGHAAAWDSSSGLQRTTSPGPAAASTTTWAAGSVGSDAMLQRSNSPLMFTSYPEAARSESPLSLAGTSSRHFQQQHQQVRLTGRTLRCKRVQNPCYFPCSTHAMACCNKSSSSSTEPVLQQRARCSRASCKDNYSGCAMLNMFLQAKSIDATLPPAGTCVE